MDKYHYGEIPRPERIKRIFESVVSLQIFDSWNNPPTKAKAYYWDFDSGLTSSKPIKIRERKNGTYYVQFEGHRYTIDITRGTEEQFLK